MDVKERGVIVLPEQRLSQEAVTVWGQRTSGQEIRYFAFFLVFLPFRGQQIRYLPVIPEIVPRESANSGTNVRGPFYSACFHRNSGTFVPTSHLRNRILGNCPIPVS